MTDELKQRMARLRALAPRLNNATDQASKLLTLVEKFLTEELRIGISAESSVFNFWSAGKDDDGKSLMVYQTLAFGRISGAFRIHVVDELKTVDDEGRPLGLVSRQATLWPSCGREIKLRAVEQLPELLDQIISETERLAETAGDTASRIGEMIGDIKVTVAAPEVAIQIMTCPSCGEKGKWLNVGARHWCACDDCEVKWPIGANLDPSWQDETEEDWKRNEKLLAGYSEME